MTCYVEDVSFYIFGRNTMYRLTSDTERELDAMADRIGIARMWKQNAGTRTVHYYICESKRKKAIDAGAVEVKTEKLVMIKKEPLNG